MTPARLRSGAIGGDDYPAAAMRNGEEGQVAVVIIVGPDGRASEVRVERSSGSESLDGATCRIVQRRFRYAPARGDHGEAIPSEVRQTVTWRLDDREESNLPQSGPLEKSGPGRFAKGISRLFGGGRSSESAARPEPVVEQAPPQPSALELAYRALLRWDDECMKPRLETLAAAFAERLRAIEPPHGPGREQAADALTAEYGGWFDQQREAFVREAVSYLDDDVLHGLRELGVDDQFGTVILDAVAEARETLRARIWDARGSGRET